MPADNPTVPDGQSIPRPSELPDEKPKSANEEPVAFVPPSDRREILSGLADKPIRDFDEVLSEDDPTPHPSLGKNQLKDMMEKPIKEDIEQNKQDFDKSKEQSDKGKDATDKGKEWSDKVDTSPETARESIVYHRESGGDPVEPGPEDDVL